MKKTVTALAILASSSSAFAIVGPGGPNRPVPERKTFCLAAYDLNDGSAHVGSCDKSAQNTRNNAKLLENGCAAGQVALNAEVTEVSIEACTNFVQL